MYLAFARADAINHGQTVVVTYTDPTAGDDDYVLEDAAGNEVATLTTGEGGVPERVAFSCGVTTRTFEFAAADDEGGLVSR